ncbi:hypothetical protein D3C85_1754430 [compost metagenome]
MFSFSLLWGESDVQGQFHYPEAGFQQRAGQVAGVQRALVAEAQVAAGQAQFGTGGGPGKAL